MDSFMTQFRFLHTLLPYFPCEYRITFSYILYFMEFQHMLEAIKVEQELLRAAPDKPEMPNTDQMICMISNQMPGPEGEQIKKMLEMFKLMNTMNSMQNSCCPPPFPPPVPPCPPPCPPPPCPPPPVPPCTPCPPPYGPPPCPPPPAPPQHNVADMGMFNSGGMNANMLKGMLSPKQQQLFETYQNMLSNM